MFVDVLVCRAAQFGQNYYIAYMLLYIDIDIIIYYYYYCYYIKHILVCIRMQATISCKMTMRTCVAL